MSGAPDLGEAITDFLKTRFTHERMADAATVVGFTIPPSDGEISKRNRARTGLEGKTERELGEIARKLGAHFNDFRLEETGLAVLERASPRLTQITRRDVAKCFGDDLSGEQDVVALVGGLFPLGLVGSGFFASRSLADEIEQHMARNPGDWSVEYLFEQIGALTCSRDRFARLIEAALHPLGRRGPGQAELAASLNEVLRRDGYELKVDGEESGYPLYRLSLIARGVAGAPKNLIFASNGPKPEIGFSDAINNDIVILSNAGSCLVYDRPIRRDGLLWSELVKWWRDQDPSAEEPARALGERLHASLASEAERNFFNCYFKLYRHRLGDELPALVPQVYLHYDPAVVKLLRNRAGLRRQRMDFLLLLPGNQRVVIEVDGSQHFSANGKPSLQNYAEMVSADRDLRLAGYEIYRFGSNELVGVSATAVIEGFFDRLWALHKLMPPNS